MINLFKLTFLSYLIFTSLTFAKTNYPNHWWQAVDESSAPSWEILPQAAQNGEVILSKRNELGILSNFATTPFILDGKKYQSVEGFWQMMKFPEGARDSRYFSSLAWETTREEVSQQTGFKAKKLGDHGSKQMKHLGINWVTYKGNQLPYRVTHKGKHYKIIRRAMEAKLTQNPKVRKILLSTGSLELRPDHKQEDVPPAWMYATIWMELRSKIK